MKDPSFTAVCRSIHFFGRPAILAARPNGSAQLLISVQHCPDDPGILVGHGDDGAPGPSDAALECPAVFLTWSQRKAVQIASASF